MKRAKAPSCAQQSAMLLGEFLAPPTEYLVVLVLVAVLAPAIRCELCVLAQLTEYIPPLKMPPPSFIAGSLKQ